MITKVMPGWAHRWLVGGKELVMVLHLECHVLQDLDEQLCRKLDKSQLPVCTSTTTRASCLVEEIVRKYFTNFHKYFYWQETDWISWYIWKSFYNHLPFALSFPGAVRPGMRPHPHRRRRNPTSSRPPSPPRLPTTFHSTILLPVDPAPPLTLLTSSLCKYWHFNCYSRRVPWCCCPTGQVKLLLFSNFHGG